jgi:hypothetical protein
VPPDDVDARCELGLERRLAPSIKIGPASRKTGLVEMLLSTRIGRDSLV